MAEKNAIKVGVGAVIFRGDEALLIKRGKAPFRGQWSIPGGGLHYGETIAAAIVREVREETGVEIGLLGFLGVFEALPAETGGHTVIVDHFGEWVAGEPRAGDDAAAAEFVPLEEAIRRVTWDQTRQALRRAAALRNQAANRL